MEDKIRLTSYEKKIISDAFRNHFGLEDHIWLFGSRANPLKRGGDIDLYIETNEATATRVHEQKLAFVNELWLKLGEQKIDVIIRLLNSDFYLPIYDAAKTEGVQII
jgi:hypothetical protein